MSTKNTILVCDDDFFKNDYQEITNYFSDDYIAYEDTIEQMRKLAEMLPSAPGL